MCASQDSDELRDEYLPSDFTAPFIRGKYHKAMRSGDTVRITHSDGTPEEYIYPQEGRTIRLDPDLQERFPDSESVNRALRSLLGRD